MQNFNVSWALHLRGKIKRAITRLPQEDREKIEVVLLELSENPYSGDIVKLDSEDNLWRRRIGAYRIKFQIRTDDKTVYVYEIERRTSKTY